MRVEQRRSSCLEGSRWDGCADLANVQIYEESAKVVSQRNWQFRSTVVTWEINAEGGRRL